MALMVTIGEDVRFRVSSQINDYNQGSLNKLETQDELVV